MVVGRLSLIRATAPLAALLALGAADAPFVASIDHIPTAVADLPAAVADLTALGFVLKPGRAHANGLRNAHIKFPDGSYIELISPAAGPTDALASEYARRLTQGDGAVFVGFNTTGRGSAAKRLPRGDPPDAEDGMLTFPASSALHPFFLLGRRSPAATDRPAHYAHANTAYSVGAVWIAASRYQRATLQRLTGKPKPIARCGYFPDGTTALPLGEGEIILLPAGRRPIIGATILVRSIATAAAALDHNRIAYERRSACPRSVWITRGRTHGLALELREATR